jgi:hypothetical protein
MPKQVPQLPPHCANALPESTSSFPLNLTPLYCRLLPCLISYNATVQASRPRRLFNAYLLVPGSGHSHPQHAPFCGTYVRLLFSRWMYLFPLGLPGKDFIHTDMGIRRAMRFVTCKTRAKTSIHTITKTDTEPTIAQLAGRASPRGASYRPKAPTSLQEKDQCGREE